jgi:hypothetical protein
MRPKVIDECKLCGKTKKLCQSHIIPEFMYKPIYDEKHKALKMQDTLSGEKGAVQKGYRAYILCEDCEQFVNDTIEKPFLALWNSSQLPDKLSSEKYIVRNLTYDVVKLFVLLNLWRAEFDSTIGVHVSLGQRHKSRLREMILALNPGKIEEYPVWGNLLVNQKGEVEKGLLCNYMIARFDGHHVYYAVYGGIEWYTKCSSHSWDVGSRISMRENGDILLGVQKYEESNAVKHFVRMAAESGS